LRITAIATFTPNFGTDNEQTENGQLKMKPAIKKLKTCTYSKDLAPSAAVFGQREQHTNKLVCDHPEMKLNWSEKVCGPCTLTGAETQGVVPVPQPPQPVRESPTKAASPAPVRPVPPVVTPPPVSSAPAIPAQAKPASKPAVAKPAAVPPPAKAAAKPPVKKAKATPKTQAKGSAKPTVKATGKAQKSAKRLRRSRRSNHRRQSVAVKPDNSTSFRPSGARAGIQFAHNG
jgi:hypothetical protein